MATKKKAENIEIEGELLNSVSYSAYYNRIPLFTSFRIYNPGEENLSGVTVSVSGSTPLVLPATYKIEEIPHESSIEVRFDNILNPKYLADIDQSENCTVTVKVTCGKTEICELKADVEALPIDCWSGLSGNAEMLAPFVRPKLADCRKILAEAGLQLRTWGYSSEFSGYAGNDKNAVRNAFASIYTAIRRLDVVREGDGDLTGLTCAGDIHGLSQNKKATPLGLALFAASCLEAARLNPVILLGKKSVGVGVWLYESCFSSSLQDDMPLIERYLEDGVNNLGAVDVEDMFAHKNASYATSEAHAISALGKGAFEVCVDIKRCRIGGLFPLPIKVKTDAGYELLGEGQFSVEQKPSKIIDASTFGYKKAASKDKTWQRRLLDLSLKNNLLNFRYKKDCLKIVAPDVGSFCAGLEKKDKFTLVAGAAADEKEIFSSAAKDKGLNELSRLEMESGKLRCAAGNEVLSETAQSLIRKARAAEEEAGAKTLYLAVGFLKWRREGEKEDKYAPIALMPVNLKKPRNQGVVLEPGEKFEVNTTLLEFLKEEFSLDIRGVEDTDLSPSELMAVFRSGTADMKGWQVYDGAYLAQFTFVRYAMWADVRKNIDIYRKNPLIESLLTNSYKLPACESPDVNEDDGDPREVLLPLPYDSAQYAAVARSAKGETFVLHGPPGTGKSQTITNMIANAVASGKRVLFVAEKQAALEVVKKRLSEIGIGEFCLSLHSGKADKAEAVRSIEHALSLSGSYDAAGFSADAGKIVDLREKLRAPFEALHKKRRLGISVYEAIVGYLENKSAPELMDIESTFYDSLTREKLAECESMLNVARAAAKECGGVYRSPFAEVRITSCDKKVKAAVVCAAEVVLAELKHLKNYLGLFLETFNQKVSKFTDKKLESLSEICKMLNGEELAPFFGCDGAEFYKFYNANLRYDRETEIWLKRFRSLPDIGKLAPETENEIDKWGDNYRSSRVLLQVIKRINKCGEPLKEKDELEWIKRAAEIEKARAAILSNTTLSKQFSGFGGINAKKREEFLKPLYALHSLAAQVFMDYNADAFNGVCIDCNGVLKPLIEGVLSSAAAFEKSAAHFMRTIKAQPGDFADADIFEVYTEKCTALIDNADMLPAWCEYKATAKKLNEYGLTFITDAMERGRISGKQILSSFRKNVYRNFIQTNIPADDALAAFSASVADECASEFSRVLEEFSALTREKIRADLISRLPAKDTEGALALELMAFQRSVKGNMRGLSLRTLFSEIPTLLKATSPCMLMSPITVSQFLPPDPELFDMVIFDEASQMPTCEAVPSLARAKSAVIVGDPKQMPPTLFFMGAGADEEHPEAEDLESVLEDCLALGVPEEHLLWHYRSKHESLIAFSNIMYYSGRLCTFPSPDALESKVKLRYIEDGVYDRGSSKCNKAEAEALVAEVVRRLKDPARRSSSIGIVTFSAPQQIYVEKLLGKEIARNGLESAAYERDEPVFVKNLENVQGDERDVILFSVCYGPDRLGKISLNFGPLNQFGGWRRLNVAVSRAREEMIVFSSMRYSMIDMSRTTSRGVAGLKAFLEFAEKGRTNIAQRSDEIIINRQSIGKYVADELSAYGYDCRCNVGVSDFKIDVAVVDPSDKRRFILGVLCDGAGKFSVKDRSVMQAQTLKRNNWNVLRLYSVNFFNNPKREIKKIKEYLDKLTKGGKNAGISFKKPYRATSLKLAFAEPSEALSGARDADLARAVKAVVAAEEPITEQFLIKRSLSLLGITRYGVKLESKMRSVIAKCGFSTAELAGCVCYFKNDKFSSFDRCRVEEGEPMRSADSDFCPYDVVSLIRGILLSKVSVYCDELVPMALKELRVTRSTEKLQSMVLSCIDEGIKRGIFIRSVSDKISLV